MICKHTTPCTLVRYGELILRTQTTPRMFNGRYVVDLQRLEGLKTANRKKRRKPFLARVPIDELVEFPTPEDIQAGCAEVQAGWTESQERMRRFNAVGLHASHDETAAPTPVVPLASLLGKAIG